MLSIIISVILIAVAVIIDQITKYWIVASFNMGEYLGLAYNEISKVASGLESVEIIHGVFRFTFLLNDGAALGSMDNARWLFMTASTIAIIGILVFLFWKKPQNKLLLASLILITGGGIGNMIDRVFLGYVIDFIDFCAFPSIWMWVFNVADVFVCIGAGMMMLYIILSTIEEAKLEKAQKAAINEKGSAEDGEQK